jgi:hypothetical protein
MRRLRYPVGYYIIFALFVIGVLSSLLRSSAILIPVIIFGLVFLLYKYPPDRWKWKWPGKRPGPARTRREKTRKASFRVIEGNKDKDSGDRPKSH